MRDKGLAIALVASLAAAPPAPHAPPQMVRVAEGIYQFITPPYGDVGLDGNAVAILSNDGVLVFDSNGTPAAAEAVIAQIRKLTDKPVKYLVNSHWHWDHWYGSEAYVRAFPGIHIVSQAGTRAMMAGPALEFNRPGIETQLPAYIASLEKKVGDAEHATPPPADLPKLRARLDDDRFFFDQKKNVRHVLPDLTYIDQMTIYLGDADVTETIRTPEVTAAVSAIARVPEVRAFLTGLFRDIIQHSDRDGIVVEGRDITTVVCPDAPVRILLTADEAVRMARRSAELADHSAAHVGEALRRRDAADSRVVDFMNAADGVTTVDSTDLDFDQTVDAVIQVVQKAAHV